SAFPSLLSKPVSDLTRSWPRPRGAPACRPPIVFQDCRYSRNTKGECEMNRSIVAGAALCAGLAIATPMLAWSASEAEPRIAQAGPDMGQSMGPGMGMGMGGGPGGGDERRMGGHHH